MIYAGTGHRPEKLGGYGLENIHLVDRFATEILRTIFPRPTLIYSGMAQGWDQALATACIILEIPFVACVPFNGQAVMWPYTARTRYDSILKCASNTIVVEPGAYAAWKLQARNEYMVDQCQSLLALWNGSSGGTKNCIDYAIKCQRPVENLWSRWELFRIGQH